MGGGGISRRLIARVITPNSRDSLSLQKVRREREREAFRPGKHPRHKFFPPGAKFSACESTLPPPPSTEYIFRGQVGEGGGSEAIKRAAQGKLNYRLVRFTVESGGGAGERERGRTLRGFLRRVIVELYGIPEAEDSPLHEKSSYIYQLQLECRNYFVLSCCC